MSPFIRAIGLSTLLAITALAAPAHAENLSQLLTSSPWCTFSYNQITGTSRSKRYIFYPNGTYAIGNHAESYNSGKYGSVAGESRGQVAGRWGVQGNILYIAENGGAPDSIPVQVYRNNNGYPVIKASGVEYSKCR